MVIDYSVCFVSLLLVALMFGLLMPKGSRHVFLQMMNWTVRVVVSVWTAVILLDTVGLKCLVGTGAVLLVGKFYFRPVSRWFYRVWLDAVAQDLPGWQTLKRFFKRAGCNLKTSGRRKRFGLWHNSHRHPDAPCLVMPRRIAWMFLAVWFTSSVVSVSAVGGWGGGQALVRLSSGNIHAAANMAVTQYLLGHSFTQLPAYNLPEIISAVSEMGVGGEERAAPHPTYVKDPEGKYIWGGHPDMSADEWDDLKKVVRDRRGAFAYSMQDLTGYTGVAGPYTIKLKDGVDRVFRPPRRYSHVETQVLKEKIAELEAAGVVKPAPPNTPYASCPVLPAKRDSQGNWTERRFCVDFRPLNKVTIQDRYGLHRADDLFDRLGGAKYFSKIDLRSGFHQIPIAEEDQPKTAFWVGNKLYMYCRMSMGLTNSPSAFSRILDTEIASNGLQDHCICFIDDLLIYSNSADEHAQHVARVLDMLSGCGLKAHPEKSVFGAAVVEYLGHNVSQHGLTPAEAKVLAIRELRVPTNVSELRQVLGFMNYYRGYVPNYSAIQAPLNSLLQKGVPWQWTAIHQAAYDKLKDELCKPGNALGQFAAGLETKLYTDWSSSGIGCVLSQVDKDGREFMVACLSRSLNKHERNYSSFEGELLAVVWSVKSLRHYLHGHHFTVITDHQPLKWLMDNESLVGKHARWALSMQDFDFSVVHRPGAKHQNADTLSRFPCASTEDITGAQLDVEANVAVVHSTSTVSTAQFSKYLATMTPNAVSLEAYSSYLHLNLQDGVMMAPGAEGFMDDFAPTSGQLLDGHGRMLARDFIPEPVSAEPPARAEMVKLKAAATEWVFDAMATLASVNASAEQPLQVEGKANKHRIQPTVGVSTGIVGPRFFQAAEREGVVLLELFGGMCAGLEMCLKNGLRIKRYLYCDNNPTVRILAASRVEKLAARYPHLLPRESFQQAFLSIPQNVRQLRTKHLVKAGACEGAQWFVIGGWECQDLSPAGNSAGIEGPRSNTFKDAVRITGALQQLQPHRPPAYLWENTSFQYNWNSQRVAKKDFETVCAAMGRPICLDAAQFGSRAHRSRNFWTNLADVALLEAVKAHIVRPARLLVDDVLDEGRKAQLALADDVAPQHYHCNTRGEPLQALPTFVAVQRSRAFRGGKQGEIFDAQGVLVEPNPAERERALGYSGTDTAHLLLSEKDRHEITGRCMDANCMAGLLAICWELTRVAVCSDRPLILKSMGEVTGAAAECLQLLPEGSDEVEVFMPVNVRVEDTSADLFSELVLPVLDDGMKAEFELLCLLSEVAEAEEVMVEPENLSNRDVWMDREMLDYLWYRAAPSDTAALARVKQRARRYRWLEEGEGKLLRVMPDGTTRVVPAPDERVDVVKKVHESLGHFGVKRTRRLVMLSYWWSGMEDDVVRVLKACPHCQQLNTQFTARPTALQPLPIEGYLYRWSCDLAGPLPLTKLGNRYVFIAIEHFSKHIEVAAIPNKEAATTSAVFLAQVLCRFGACAEVVTDQGTEWHAEFHDLLSRSFIDHRMTSPSHPQANGLTERAVQTFKNALAKYCAQENTAEEWDRHLHYVALGYRCSPQASTRVSPFELMYGVSPVLPMAARPAFEQALEFPALPLLANQGELASGGESISVIDPGAGQVADILLRRAAVLKDKMAAVDENLRVAQQRDTLRYAAKRDGKWQPRETKFVPGDFVYRKRTNRVSTLQPKAADGVYRVYEVRDSGVLILQGKCGSLVPEHVQNCAPCHLTGFDPTINPTLAPVPPDLPCEVCGSPDEEHEMLLCDSCNAGYHMRCLNPPLKKVPVDEWICPRCKGFGVTVGQIRQRDEGNPANRSGHIFRNKSQRLRDTQARALEGRLVRWYPGTKSHEWGPGPFYGMLRYEGDNAKYPKPLWGEFELGRQGPWSLSTALKLLLPEGTTVPLIAATVMPAQQSLVSATAYMTALTQPVPISPSAAAALQSAIVSRTLAFGLDAWTVSTVSSHPLKDLVCALTVNRLTINEPSADPLQLRALQGWALQHPLDVVFVSVPGVVIEEVVMAVLPLALQLVCVWVPAGTMDVLDSARLQWLEGLRQMDLVRVIPVGDEGRWILLARATSVWPKCLTTAALAMTAWV
jgi:RNase H-like domain found in reverse transcriptase/Reverse transcriptase (RNA-dependent DNA polymerase)/Integrase zinc binding domain/PHD-finger/Integrase core domain